MVNFFPFRFVSFQLFIKIIITITISKFSSLSGTFMGESNVILLYWMRFSCSMGVICNLFSRLCLFVRILRGLVSYKTKWVNVFISSIIERTRCVWFLQHLIECFLYLEGWYIIYICLLIIYIKSNCVLKLFPEDVGKELVSLFNSGRFREIKIDPSYTKIDHTEE